MKPMQSTQANYILLLMAQLMVGISIVTSKSLLVDISPLIILLIRFMVAALFLLLFHLMFSKQKVRILGQLSTLDWLFIVAQGLCAGAFFNSLLLLGLQYTTASIAGIITSALPAIIAVFTVVILREKITIFTALCITFAVIGLVIINAHSLEGGNHHHLLGALIVFFSLIPEASYYILTKIHQNRLPVFLVSFLMNLVNIPFFTIILFFHHKGLHFDIHPNEFGLLIIVGLSSAFFYVFWYLGSKHIKSAVAGLSTAFMPIATLVIAWIFLNETISLLQLFGMILVIFSIMFSASRSKPSKL